MKENLYWQFYEDVKEQEESKLTWKDKMLIGLFALCASWVLERMARRNQQIRHIKNKVKYMKPTIHDTMFGKHVSWEMRDKPLTDIEISQFEN